MVPENSSLIWWWWKIQKSPNPKLPSFITYLYPSVIKGTGMVPPASSSSSLSSSPPKALGLISCAAKSVENLSPPINLINLLQPSNHIVLDCIFGGLYFCGFVQSSKLLKPSNFCNCTLYLMCVISNICVFVNSLVTNYKQILLTNIDWPKFSVQNYSGKSKWKWKHPRNIYLLAKRPPLPFEFSFL